MLTQDPNYVCLFVEGKTNRTFFRNFLDKNAVRIQCPENKQTQDKSHKEVLVELMKTLNLKGRTNSLCIVDADYDHLNNHEEIENLYRTQYHDLEVDIISTDVFEKLFETCSDADKRRNYFENGEDNAHKKILQEACEIAYEYGLVRYMLHLKYTDLPCIPAGTRRAPELHSYVKHRRNRLQNDLDRFKEDVSQNHHIHNIDRSVNCIRNQDPDPKQIVRGHDLTYVVAILMKPVLKRDCYREGLQGIIEDLLIGCTELRHFKKMNVWKKIEEWFSTHSRQSPIRDS